MTTPDDNHEEVTDYETQAREFLGVAWDFLSAGNLHQAPETGWGAASHMAKAVASAQGWEYGTHAEFGEVMYEATQLANNPCIQQLRGVANELHLNYYKRKRHLNAGAIRGELETIRRAGNNIGVAGNAASAYRAGPLTDMALYGVLQPAEYQDNRPTL